MATPVKDAAWLRWIERSVKLPGLEIPGAGASSPCFHCCLDEQPDHLVPEYSLRNQKELGHCDQELYINSSAWFLRNGAFPKDIADILDLPQRALAEESNLVCIRDPGSMVLQPFWLGPALSSWLQGAQTGLPGPSSLPAEVRRILAMANVLVPKNWARTRQEEWDSAISAGARIYQQRGFVPVRQLIHPFHLSSMRRYYRHLIRAGLMSIGDGQCARRYVAHNEPVASFFHRQLAPVVSALTGKAIKTSYTYVGSYQEGALLEEHTDREQCEFSVTLCLDYAPEPRLATPWPIQLHTSSGMTKVFQAIGDALLYRGRDIPHSRGILPQGHTSTSIFFHYVRKDFVGGLN